MNLSQYWRDEPALDNAILLLILLMVLLLIYLNLKKNNRSDK